MVLLFLQEMQDRLRRQDKEDYIVSKSTLESALCIFRRKDAKTQSFAKTVTHKQTNFTFFKSFMSFRRSLRSQNNKIMSLSVYSVISVVINFFQYCFKILPQRSQSTQRGTKAVTYKQTNFTFFKSFMSFRPSLRNFASLRLCVEKCIKWTQKCLWIQVWIRQCM